MSGRRGTPWTLPILAAFSGFEELLAEASHWYEARFGPILLESEPYLFDQTRYYEAEMGTALRKRLFAFGRPQPADFLAEAKNQAIDFERSVADTGRFPVPRPLNLDPGYLDESKFVLASTKDHSHRLYLGAGIFAEITANYSSRTRNWEPLPWTYPDYRLDTTRNFLLEARERFRALKVSQASGRS